MPYLRRLFLFIFCLHYLLFLFGQSTSASKKNLLIDTSAIDRWPSLKEDVSISADGNYAYYAIQNQPYHQSTYIIKATNGEWQKEIVLNNDQSFHCYFAFDGKSVVYFTNDSLYQFVPGTNKYLLATAITSYKTSGQSDISYIAYQHKGDSLLHVTDLVSGKDQTFACIIDYVFAPTGNILLLQKERKEQFVISTIVERLDLAQRSISPILEKQTTSGNLLFTYAFHEQTNQICISATESINNHPFTSFYYYKPGMQLAKRLVNDSAITKNLSIEGYPQFTKNGKYILFRLIASQQEQISPPSRVLVWSYKDAVIQPEQERQRGLPRSYLCVIQPTDAKVLQLEKDNEMLLTHPGMITGDYIVVMDHTELSDRWWHLSPQSSFYVVSLKDGIRTLLPLKNPFSSGQFSFSPSGRYLVYYEPQKRAFISFDLLQKKYYCISQKIPTSITREYINEAGAVPVAYVVGWHMQDSSLLIYDNYDIWKVAPSNNIAPVNITHGYGYKHHIKLNVIGGPHYPGHSAQIFYKGNAPLLLTAFDIRTKLNGFYKTSITNKDTPTLLTMGPWTYFRTYAQKPHSYSFSDGMPPLKAAKTDAWIVLRQSATEAPNYLFTKDLVRYTSISNLQPQKAYNWLTSTLINYPQLDGSYTQGILYKPGDFDPQKKYPVLFTYYEQLSHRLYEYPTPELSMGEIDIPWFVSRGYLVFTPDIHHTIATLSNKTAGENAYNSVVGAGIFLGKQPYINSKRMGIYGHSFGGMETNYLVTHTSIFAAAAEMAGSADPISAYLTLLPALPPYSGVKEHLPKQSIIELGHELYNSTPWERPDLYKRNSAVLSADKTSTPFLITHNQKDNQVQYRQGIEMYMALRRLGKKVWMLQYKNGTHALFGADALDYTIRLTQFFDYYLKDTPPPAWMTTSSSGYEYDTSGTLP